MRNFKILFIGILIFCLTSCQQQNCSSISILKLDFQEGCTNSRQLCHEVYVASCLDVNNTKDIDTLDALIARSYSVDKAKKFDYVITVLKYDLSGENGINNTTDLSKYWNEYLNDHSDWFLATYSWSKGKFEYSNIFIGDKRQEKKPNIDSLSAIFEKKR